jgi:hypothetical protein
MVIPQGNCGQPELRVLGSRNTRLAKERRLIDQ